MKNQRYIAHIDMDAFFASVEQRDNSQYKNKPVIIGSDPKEGSGRGVVATCSYEARIYGIHSAMPISIAYKKCPNGIFLRPNMEKYVQISDEIYDIFHEFTPDVEPVSIDEAFLDITHTAHLFKGPEKTCKKIKERIKEETLLTASCGLAASKMVAKIASDIGKPDGFVHVPYDNTKEFLHPLSIDKISGIGPKTTKILQKHGIYKIEHLAKKNIELLAKLLGKNAYFFWGIANGIDNAEIYVSKETGSISKEYTFDNDTSDQKLIESIFMSLSEYISASMRNENIFSDTIVIKIRTDDYQTITRTKKLFVPTNYVDDIFTNAGKLFLENFDKTKKIRLIGIKMAKINKKNQHTLFCESDNETKEKIHSVVEKINKKHGREKIQRAVAKRR
ncbi:MAG: DNA polymerase IV [Candidatus Omnitrophica bacterium]|nr:DNA polymerase IV [Candidatus Omnitrophota bacterium]